MFKIISNDFIKNDVVKYADENENTIRITGSKDGKTLSAKLRLKNNVKVDVIRLEFPYKIEGLNYKITYTEETYNDSTSEYIQNILRELTEIIQNWIEMCTRMYALTSNDMNMLANIFQNEECTKEDNLFTITDFILNELASYEEMHDFVDLYQKLCMATSNQ